MSNTLYQICVIGIGSWLTYQNDFNTSSHILLGDGNSLSHEAFPETLKSQIAESMTSRCTEVRTLFALPNVIEMDGLSSGGFIHSILTRRLGLIVGCCLGIVVFIVLISVLGWLKIKKQRIENAKRQQTIPPDFLSYRSYSIPNEELKENNKMAAAANHAEVHSHANGSNCHHHHLHTSNMHGHPNYISGTVLGTTTITGNEYVKS